MTTTLYLRQIGTIPESDNQRRKDLISSLSTKDFQRLPAINGFPEFSSANQFVSFLERLEKPQELRYFLDMYEGKVVKKKVRVRKRVDELDFELRKQQSEIEASVSELLSLQEGIRPYQPLSLSINGRDFEAHKVVDVLEYMHYMDDVSAENMKQAIADKRVLFDQLLSL